MSFKEDLQKLSIQINERKGHITNEETTKQALIIPFIQVLGYDVFNPLEIKPEYVSDFGKKKAEKVDYAIFKDGSPIIFIEAKSVTENLQSHDSQLARYFNATPEVKLAILTNGVIYKFYTDIDSNNIMDEEPFAIIDITSSLTSIDIETLNKFRKEYFETDSVLKYVEELIYSTNINNKLRELFKNPSDEFIRFLIKDFSDARITSNVLERFRPIVKKAISNALLEIVTQGLTKEDPPEEVTTPQEAGNNCEPENKRKKGIVTTPDELESFELIKKILANNNKDVSEVNYKDTTSYFGIYNKNINHWFIRLNLDSQNKFIITKLSIENITQLVNGFKVEAAPKGYGESRVFINSYHDIEKLDQLIVACFEASVIS